MRPIGRIVGKAHTAKIASRDGCGRLGNRDAAALTLGQAVAGKVRLILWCRAYYSHRAEPAADGGLVAKRGWAEIGGMRRSCSTADQPGRTSDRGA